MRKLLTTPEAARCLGVNNTTIIRWCRSGKLAGAYIALGSRKLGWRIPADTILELAKDKERDYARRTLSAELARDQLLAPV